MWRRVRVIDDTEDMTSVSSPVEHGALHCAPGTALHRILAEAVDNGDTVVFVNTTRTGIHWARRRTRDLSQDERRQCEMSAHQMVKILLSAPPVGMTDPGELFLHALGRDEVVAPGFLSTDLQAVIGTEVTSWWMVYEHGDLPNPEEDAQMWVRLKNRPDSAHWGRGPRAPMRGRQRSTRWWRPSVIWTRRGDVGAEC